MKPARLTPFSTITHHAIAGLMLAGATAAQAQYGIPWICGDDDWFKAECWASGRVPSADQVVETGPQRATITVSGPSPASADALLIDPGSQLRMWSGSLLVRRELAVAGTLQIDGGAIGVGQVMGFIYRGVGHSPGRVVMTAGLLSVGGRLFDDRWAPLNIVQTGGTISVGSLSTGANPGRGQYIAQGGLLNVEDSVSFSGLFMQTGADIRFSQYRMGNWTTRAVDLYDDRRNDYIYSGGTLTRVGMVNGGRLTVLSDMTLDGLRNEGAISPLAYGRRLTTGHGGFENAGHFAQAGGTLASSGGIVNAAGATWLVQSKSTVVTPAGPLVNRGLLHVKDGANLSVEGDLQAESGSELRVDAGSAVSFIGGVTWQAGALSSGTGALYFKGGLQHGSGPGAIRLGGSAWLGEANDYSADIGGTLAGDEFGQLVVGGALKLGGTLTLRSADGFVARAGDRFQLFDAGRLSGRFGALDFSEFMLADGAAIDLSMLYRNGSIAVTAVPEPASLALLGLGLALMPLLARCAPLRQGGNRGPDTRAHRRAGRVWSR